MMLPEAGESRFRAIFENAPVASVVTDLDGVVRDVNRAFTELVSCPRDAVAGTGRGSVRELWGFPDSEPGQSALPLLA